VDATELAVFCDFDGTFSVQDVGSTLARIHLGGRRKALWSSYERGDVTAWEYNVQLFDGFALPQAELETFLRGVELDPGAKALVAWCGERRVPFRILSDGFDYNLDRLQEIHGVDFDYTANHLRYEADVWRIAPGSPNPACGCGTGTCKRRIISAYRERHPQHRCVHVGNGRVSDLCAAHAAEWVFAKDSLAEALQTEARPYAPFETLHDVIADLERMIAPAAQL
jgi:2,3-diketo-5-methylthio-1-phosphopentane phosphatase